MCAKVISAELDPEVVEKNEEYIKYIERHVSLVQKSYEDIKETLLKTDPVFQGMHFSDGMVMGNLETAIKNHDASKYSDIEFNSYRRRFYPTKIEQEEDQDEFVQLHVKEEFDEAWKHHYTVNDHHSAYWNPDNNDVTKDMPYSSIVHMICDWEAMSIAQKGSTIDWYLRKSQEERSHMTKNTIEILEALMRDIFEYEGDFVVI